MTSSNNVNSSAASVGVNQVGSRTFVSGQGLGFDTSSLVNAAVQQRERPAVELDAKTQLNLAQVEAFNQLDTLGTTLGTTLSDLQFKNDILGQDINAFDQRTISGSTSSGVEVTSLLDASVDHTAAAGTYEVVVQQVAQAMKVQSGDVASNNTALGYTGSMSIGLVGGSAVTVNVAASDTLEDIAAAINTQMGTSNVSAQILQVSENNYRLILTAEETNRDITLSDTSGSVLSSLGLLVAAVPNELQEARGAEITFDGVTVTRDTNSFEDLVEGLDITVANADPGSTITLEVGNDTAAVRTAVNNFIEQYNELRSYMEQQQQVSAEGEVEEAAVLNGDTTLQFMQSQLATLLSTQFNSSGDVQTLRDLGIQIAENNMLVIGDTTQFEDQLANNFDQFRALFETSFQADSDQIRMQSMTSATQSFDFTLAVTTDGSGNVTGATADGVAVFDVTPSGVLTGMEGTAYEGVVLTYVGGVDTSISVQIGQGFADMAINTLNNYTDDISGQIKDSVDQLLAENVENDTRAERIRDQASDLRDTLIARYADLEAQVRAAEILQKQISALLGNNDDD